MKTTGQLIFSIRTSLKLSRSELAFIAGVHYLTIYNAEHGHHKPRVKTLEKIINAFQKTLKEKEK